MRDQNEVPSPTILEVALNGPWGRSRQPLIPVTVADIVADGIACGKAGATVIHVHPYDEKTGQQNDDLDTYIRIIEGIREKVDVLVYPTAPFTDDDGLSRYDVTAELARRGLIQWATMDPGSVNIARYDDLAVGKTGFVYRNTLDSLRVALSMAAELGVVPSYACYEPGHVRLGAACHVLEPKAPTPLYRLMLSDEFIFGFPPSPYALDAYQRLMEGLCLSAPVMVAGLGVDVLPLIPDIVSRDWHVRVGLEDAPFTSRLTNVQLVESAVASIERAGKRVARSGDIASLGLAVCREKTVVVGC